VQVAREGARDAVFDVPAQVKDSATRNAGITVALVDDPKITATGTVREVSPARRPVTGTFAVPCSSRTASADASRQHVTGRISSTPAPTIQIPASRPDSCRPATAVWEYDPKPGTVAARSITVAGSNATTVQVASGLNPGDVVVTAGVRPCVPTESPQLETPQS